MPPIDPPLNGDPFELRVLAGPQAGARAALPPRTVCELQAGQPPQAHAQDGDIVLRSAEAPVRLRLRVGRVQARVTLLEGAARCGEAPLAVGEEADWPRRRPLQFGDVVVAWGPATTAEWPADDAGTPAEAPAADEPSPSLPRRGGAERWLAGAGAALALGSALLLALAQMAAPTPADAAADPATRLARALHDSEFKQLELGRTADGRPELSGRLATQAQRNRLDGWLARQGSAALVNVRVDEQLGRDVTDVFRLHGVAVQARVRSADATLVVEAAESDGARLARAEQAVRRDVPGLGAMVVHNQPRVAAPPHPPLADDPGQRITAVIADGDLPYLVTADGSRYFVGALLPSGHRVRLIADRQVTIERDGQFTLLTL